MQRLLVAVAAAVVLFNISMADVSAETITRADTAGAVINQQFQAENQLQPETDIKDVITKEEYQPAMEDNQGLRLTLRQVKFAGDRLLPEGKLQALISPYLQKEVGMADLNQICAIISKELQANDYAVATAYLPKQDIIDGVVTIEIIGGRYGAINIKNDAALNDRRIRAEISGVKTGDFIRTSTLERSVLLLNDLSGISAKAVLSKGSQVGTSDLNIDIVKYGKKADWQLTYDNNGSYNIGQDEVGVTGKLSNFSGNGDSLYLRVNTGTVSGVTVDSSKGLVLGAVNWQTPMGSDGSKISLGYSQMAYTLGRGFTGLNFTGQANVANINWTKSIKRSRMSNFSMSLGFDNAKLVNGYPQPIGNANQTVNRFNLGLNFDNVDSSGLNVLSVTWTAGEASMDSMASIMFSDNISHTSGAYNKLAYNALRQQRIADRLALMLKISGQFADKNLVSFEDFSLGGPYGVRAYGVGEGTGDSGYLGSAELRWLLPGSDSLQFLLFYDIGGVTINNNPWAGQGNNYTKLSGYGVGVSWNRPDLYSLNLSYAWRDSSQLSTIGDYPQTNGRLWINATYCL